MTPASLDARALARIEEAAERYAATQPHPEDLESANALGDEAYLAGYVEVMRCFPSPEAFVALKRGLAETQPEVTK